MDDPTLTPAAVPLALKLTVIKPAQVTVLADGKPAFDGHVDQNETKIFSALSTIDFSSTDSDAITLELNGQLIPASGAPGQPLHRMFTQSDVKPDATVQH